MCQYILSFFRRLMWICVTCASFSPQRFRLSRNFKWHSFKNTIPLNQSLFITVFLSQKLKLGSLTFGIWRGVRSDAQLRSTETRLQKCSQSGKNGSKHPMLSISMAYNVISCKKNQKKHSNNQNCWFYNVNLAPELRNDRKSPKKRITKSRFTHFFVYVWYI